MLFPPRFAPLLLCLLGFVWAAPLAADEVIPPNPEPQWWRGNLHTHTFWSDGNDFPEMIAEWYRTHGYNFLALSDHNTLSEGQRWRTADYIKRRSGGHALEKYLARFGPDWVETRGEGDTLEVRLKPLNEFRALVEERGKFIMLQGEELSDRVQGKPLHMNASNLKEAVRPVSGPTIREAMANNLRAVEEQAKRAGREILVHLNHPNFHYAITAEDIAAVVQERFFEVYNGHLAVNHEVDHDHPSVERLWDIANTIRLGELAAPPLYGLGNDDSHNYHGRRGSNPGRGWIMVRARHLTPESLVRAIEAGDFYASSGVTLSDVRYSAESGVLELNIKPEKGVTYVTEFIGTTAGYPSESKPRLDKDGKPLPGVTRKYSHEIGKVLAREEGLTPRYKLTGKELYVRAVVTSSKHHPDPSFGHQHEQAWTQPVGWRAWLDKQSEKK
jgi:hypothetical protein